MSEAPLGAAIDTRTTNQRVYSRIAKMLAAGHWELGARLDEREISSELGVSRTPLREAIGRLVSEGVVEHRPYQGNFVRTFSPKQIDDLFEVRVNLERLAARAASERIAPAEVEALREVVRTCHAALDRGDMDEFEAADRDFHRLIVQAADNEVLSFSLRVLGLHIQLVRHLANNDPELREGTKEHRAEIVEAIAAGDGRRASDLLAKHIAEVFDSVRTAVGEQEALSA